MNQTQVVITSKLATIRSEKSEMEILTKTTTNRVTLRLQNNMLDILKNEAARKDLTLNALINKILNKSVAYDEHVNAITSIIIPYDMFISIIEKLNSSNLNELAKDSPRIVKKLFDILGIAYDVDHLIHNYFSILSKYCGWFEFSHKIAGDKYRLVFGTGSSQTWTLFIQKYVRNLLDSLRVVLTNESKNDGIIVFEFSHKNYM